MHDCQDQRITALDQELEDAITPAYARHKTRVRSNRLVRSKVAVDGGTSRLPVPLLVRSFRRVSPGFRQFRVVEFRLRSPAAGLTWLLSRPPDCWREYYSVSQRPDRPPADDGMGKPSTQQYFLILVSDVLVVLYF